MSVEEKFYWSEWTKEQDKAFENCLALYAGESNYRWEKVAAALTGKTRLEIRRHYELLVEDLNAIESGSVPLLSYGESSADGKKNVVDDSGVSDTAQIQIGIGQRNFTRARKESRAEKKRRKGIPWTQDEHRNFLKGLERFGKGDWRSISRHCVLSRTSTQVASHAQKYYNRLNSGTKKGKRTSIHDVTCEDKGRTSAPQCPAGENTAASASESSVITEKSPPHIPPSVGLITGHINEASAAGPLMMSSPSIGCPVVGPTQAVYGFNAPFPYECSIFDISDVLYC